MASAIYWGILSCRKFRRDLATRTYYECSAVNLSNDMSAKRATKTVVDSDDDLMTRICQRDHAAMRVATDRHAQTAWRIAYRMLGDATEAEDVTQESLLKLWNYADRWQAGGPGIGAWLSKVTTNQCLDQLRRNRFKTDRRCFSS